MYGPVRSGGDDMSVYEDDRASSPPAPSTAQTSVPAQSKTGQVKDEAAHGAHEVRDEVAGAVTDVRDEVSAQVANVKDEALSKANDLLGQAREQAGTQADQGTKQFADTLVSAGRELTAMAERSEQADGPMTAVVRQIGSRATEMGERFGSGGYRALAGDLSGFARSSPGMFLLAAVGAGFAVGRVVRNADTKAIASAARDDSAKSDDVDDRSLSAGSAPVAGLGAPSELADPYPAAQAATADDALRTSGTAPLGEV
jgi:hypothetical protein